MNSTGPFFHRVLPVVLFVLAGLQPVNAVSSDAEWLLIDRNANATVYVDRGSRQRTGDMVRLWVLDDLKIAHTRGADTYFSSLAREEHDCRNERFRLVAVTQFAGQMGTGKVVYERAVESNWASVPKGTLAQSVWTYACGNK